MKAKSLLLLMIGFLGVVLVEPKAWAGAPRATNAVDAARHAAELQVRNLLEPLLDKYCRDECKLMSVSANVDLAAPEEIAPGFDELDPKANLDLAPSSAQVKILMDEQIGPNSRSKLLELIQQYVDTLDFPVKIDTQVARFPQPVGSAGKVAELRERITRQFRGTLDELFAQFCPEQCLLADYDLQTDAVNPEEAQYGSAGEFVSDGGTAVRIRQIMGTILVDESLSAEERANIIEMAKLKTNYFKNVNLNARSLKFPRPTTTAQRQRLGNVLGVGPDGLPLADGQGGQKTEKSEKKESTSTSQSQSQSSNSSSSDSKSATEQKTMVSNDNRTNEVNQKQERFERFEKIERVENGDAVQKELDKFKVYGLVFACSVLSLLIFIAMAGARPKNPMTTVQRVISQLASDPVTAAGGKAVSDGSLSGNDRAALVAKRYEIERLLEELMAVFAQNPKVAKQVFTRVLTEEGVETTAQYIHLFGESVVVDMLRDPSLQADLNELMEFYAKNPMEIDDDEKLDLLRKLHNRAIAGKLAVMGSRSTLMFDYLAEMDGLQILELVRNESLTVKAIVLTQCDQQKRAAIYAQLDEDTRMKLLNELSRIDYLPRDYISNVASALKRKRRENPKLNTEALPGSEVLVTLLERTGAEMQKQVIRNLEITNPDSARTLKGKLVSINTLKYLRDGQLLEVVLSLKHDELLQFLKGASQDVRDAIFSKSPKDLVAELEDELTNVAVLSRETYQAVERKVLNRMKLMANEGIVNLIEVNDRMLADSEKRGPMGVVEAGPAESAGDGKIKKAAGW